MDDSGQEQLGLALNHLQEFSSLHGMEAGTSLPHKEMRNSLQGPAGGPSNPLFSRQQWQQQMLFGEKM